MSSTAATMIRRNAANRRAAARSTPETRAAALAELNRRWPLTPATVAAGRLRLELEAPIPCRADALVELAAEYVAAVGGDGMAPAGLIARLIADMRGRYSSTEPRR